MTPLASWGRLSHLPHDVVALRDRDAVAAVLRAGGAGITRGLGRSYGDACLNPAGTVWSTTGLDHYIDFDGGTGVLRCEAGVSLYDIQRLMLPRGWSLPVVPGTLWVTVGGAIANDVHGKNHHRHGSFGHHVRWLRLVRSDGEVMDCGPDLDAPWFQATVGGVGLTGVITQAELALKPVPGPWMQTDTLPFHGLDEFFALSDESEAEWEHTVSWIDCLSGEAGRGIFMRANAIDAGPRPPARLRRKAVPWQPPISLVNRWSLRPFNTAYYLLNRMRRGRRVQHHMAFLHPLDHVGDWNLLYGPAGFFQHQCVVPRDAVAALLREITRSGMGSFLAVLKTFGACTPPGLLSFPTPGVTLALDFPNRGEPTRALLARLDAIVTEAGGRIYLAKDASMSRQTFEAGYPRLQEFLRFRDSGISSGLSRRLMD